MYRISDLLEQSLKTHECVVLPGLGAFIKEYLFAWYNAKTNSHYPAAAEIHFNADLVARDGVLDAAYAGAFGLSMRRARLSVDEDVAALRQELYRTGQVSLGTVGSLSITESGTLRFRFNTVYATSFAGFSYGLLPQVGFTPAGETQQRPAAAPASEPTAAPGSYYNLKIRKSVLHWSAAAAVALICLLPVGLPSLTGNYSAGFSPEPSRQTIVLTPQAATMEAPSNPAERAVLPQPQPTTQEVYRYTLLEPGFYLIVGAFKTQQKADSFIQDCAHKGLNTASWLQIKKGTHYLVSYARTAGSNEAYRLLNGPVSELDQQGIRDAWVLEKK